VKKTESCGLPGTGLKTESEEIFSAKAVYDNRERLRGLKMVYEPKYLRFFQARLDRLQEG
jgi:hypothetical protein